jgi:hypothetical protein
MWSDGENYSKVVEYNGVQYRRLARSRREARHANWKRFFLSKISLKLSGLAVFGLFAHFSVSLYLSPWPASVTLKHHAARTNCSAARSVGLAQTHRGQAGCWPHLDRDNDGITCEISCCQMGL